jgi:lipopolysaccharide export LptBFGC system permease protein LptF
MIKMIITFICLFVIFFAGVNLFRRLTRKEKWSVARGISFSLLIALAVTLVLSVFVILF